VSVPYPTTPARLVTNHWLLPLFHDFGTVVRLKVICFVLTCL